MKKNIKKIFSLAFGFGVISGFGYFVYKIIVAFFGYISVIPKEIAAALIAGTATVLVATLTVVVAKYFERKRELDALHREKKTEIYDEFLKGFFDTYFSGAEDSPTQSPEDLVRFMREFMRKLLLWSGPEPIAAFVRWKDHLSKGKPDAQSLFLTEQFILAIRKDLRHSNEGIAKGFFAKLVLKNSELFLAMAEKNPNISFDDLAEIEKKLLEAARDPTGE
jgi:hypothetical protein